MQHIDQWAVSNWIVLPVKSPSKSIFNKRETTIATTTTSNNNNNALHMHWPSCCEPRWGRVNTNCMADSLLQRFPCRFTPRCPASPSVKQTPAKCPLWRHALVLLFLILYQNRAKLPWLSSALALSWLHLSITHCILSGQKSPNATPHCIWSESRG